MHAGSHPLTSTILSSYYSNVKTLYEYVNDVIGHQPAEDKRDVLTHETDTLQYRKLLSETIIATHKEVERGALQIAPPVGHLREVFERAQLRLLKSKVSNKNILTAGYRLGDSSKGSRGLSNYFINTVITVFESLEWSALYNRVGTDIIVHLLTETSIFVRLPNECLCQVAGPSLINFTPPTDVISRENIVGTKANKRSTALKRRQSKPHPDERPHKRLKTSNSINSVSSTSSVDKAASDYIRSPVEISIPRLRLFYRRPDRVSRSERIVFGLPLQHVLHTLTPPTTERGSAQKPPDTRKQVANARHLSKYVFPRQYGLACAFDTAPTGQFIPEWHDREDQIKSLGPCKTPKRLRPALDLLEKMIWRHNKCGYKALLNLACPSKISTKSEDTLDETIILEMMSENSVLLTQSKLRADSSTYSDGKTIIALGLTQARNQVKQKPRFAEFMVSYNEVFRFVMLVTKAVIPMTVWGSKTNFQHVCEQVKTFISMRRYETTTLHNLLQGFRVSDCEWLMPDSSSAHKQARVSVSDSLKRLELLQDFTYWYFASFLIPLIRTNFYVTESSAFRNKVLYFRQDDWDTLCKPLVERLCDKTFQRLSQHDAEEILRQRKLGFSFVRLLPKDTGVRPIVNLRRKLTGAKTEYGQYAQSINQIMSAAFHILTYEKESQKQLLGASVFGHNEIYTKLKAFKGRLSYDGVLPRLYFVKVDVQACFDTIEQGKLLDILRSILSGEEYAIQRHGQVCSVAGKIKRTFVKKAFPADDHPHFVRTAYQLAQALKHTIFVDQVLYPSANKKEILHLLEQHITDNIVKIGNDYYRQTIGIPQGSILSSLLCSFFYGDLERNHLKFTADLNSVLLRLIDDYLFVTTDLAQARKFLRTMHEGHPEYGCFISPDKTLTNFEDETMPNVVDPQQRTFPWCGLLIDRLDLSVSIDYSRFNDTYLQDSLTVEMGRKPGSSFVQKMMQLAKSKSHIIFTDTALNTTHTIHKNIYENFLVTAMKMHYYLRSWKPKTLQSNSKFLMTTIRQMIRYAYTTMHNKATNKIAKASGGKCETPKAVVLWLGIHAFHTALSCKSHAYQSVLRSLEFDMSLPQYRRFGKRYRKVTREGRELLTVLSF